MPFAKINRTELFYQMHGDGPALVFAHGRVCSSLSWWQQVAYFRKRFRCIVFDHRGFGQSAGATGCVDASVFSADLAALMDRLEIAEAHLVGQSMGGWTVLAFAREHPERSLSLTMADTTGGISEPDILKFYREASALPEDVLERCVAQSFVREHPERAFLFREISLLNPPPPSLSQMLKDGNGPRASDLKDFSVPTLFIVGAEDLPMPPAAIALAARAVPGAKLEVIKGAGHSAYFEKPNIFNRLLMDFIGSGEAEHRDADVSLEGKVEEKEV